MLKKTFMLSIGAVALAAVMGCADEVDPMFNEVAQVTVFSASGYTVRVGATLQLEGRAVTWAGDRVDERITQWESSDPSKATVSNSGLVTGVAVGSTDITAIADGVRSRGDLVNVTAGDGTTQ
ncbi:MAG: Ig-like domain-containing protein [Gemmatimonadaceae bacterium]|nr:Ig-like domain-containing protein [Gemmatimonadaceae bacterium]